MYFRSGLFRLMTFLWGPPMFEMQEGEGRLGLLRVILLSPPTYIPFLFEADRRCFLRSGWDVNDTSNHYIINQSPWYFQVRQFMIGAKRGATRWIANFRNGLGQGEVGKVEAHKAASHLIIEKELPLRLEHIAACDRVSEFFGKRLLWNPSYPLKVHDVWPTLPRLQRAHGLALLEEDASDIPRCLPLGNHLVVKRREYHAAT